ncbi:MAG: pyridoxamine 5'-phosphate oxidase family protein [Gallionellaceae bacterium]|nr:pyridoxamine 5'-phosphate oxidase family protein [Gallionellaceae bacterium]
MGKQYDALTEPLQAFIAAQKVFFVGTATADSRVNISPKGMDTLRVLSGNRVVWLNLTGSGNETSAHVQQDPRMTLMFCAFEGAPMILRLYGTARVIHQNDQEWSALYSHFKPLPGARQVFDLSIEMVQTSCGFGVPYLSYQEERPLLADWAMKKGEDGVRNYWQEKNQVSIDNIPTHIIEKNL